MPDQQAADLFNEGVTLAQQRHQEALRQAELVFEEMQRRGNSKSFAYRTVAVHAADQQFQRDVAALRRKHDRVDPATNGIRT